MNQKDIFVKNENDLYLIQRYVILYFIRMVNVSKKNSNNYYIQIKERQTQQSITNYIIVESYLSRTGSSHVKCIVIKNLVL